MLSGMGGLSLEKLDVYQVALRVVAECDRLTVDGRGYAWWIVRDQLVRAAVSLIANIAEGNGETHPRERARFFTYARRSADECYACLDTMVALRLRTIEEVQPAKDLLKRVVEMLVRMIQKTGTLPRPPRSTP